MMYRVCYVTHYWFKDDVYEEFDMDQAELDRFTKFVSNLLCGEYEILSVDPIELTEDVA